MRWQPEARRRTLDGLGSWLELAGPGLDVLVLLEMVLLELAVPGPDMLAVELDRVRLAGQVQMHRRLSDGLRVRFSVSGRGRRGNGYRGCDSLRLAAIAGGPAHTTTDDGGREDSGGHRAVHGGGVAASDDSPDQADEEPHEPAHPAPLSEVPLPLPT